MAAVLIFGLWKQSSSHNGGNVGRIFQAVEEARQKNVPLPRSEEQHVGNADGARFALLLHVF